MPVARFVVLSVLAIHPLKEEPMSSHETAAKTSKDPKKPSSSLTEETHIALGILSRLRSRRLSQAAGRAPLIPRARSPSRALHDPPAHA